MDPELKSKYWQALAALRKKKIADKYECSVLTYTDIHECIDIVTHQYDESNLGKFKQNLCFMFSATWFYFIHMGLKILSEIIVYVFYWLIKLNTW